MEEHNKNVASKRQKMVKHRLHRDSRSVKEIKYRYMGAPCVQSSMPHSSLYAFKSINFDTCQIGDHEMRYISERLPLMNKMESIIVENNAFRVDGFKYLAYYTRYAPRLKVLNFSYNRIFEVGFEFLPDKLRHIRYLQNLGLAFLQNHHHSSTSFLENLKYLNHVHTLNIRGHVIFRVDRGFSPENFFEHLVSLKHLDVSYYCVGEAGMQLFCDSLKQAPQLLSLKMQSNYFGEGGAATLGDSLRYITNLELLDICDNEIKFDGLKSIVSQFHIIPNLKTFILRGNQIGVEGTKFLSDHLKYITNLNHLDLSYNDVGNNDPLKFPLSFQYITNLTHLHLGTNKLATKTLKSLFSSFKLITNLVSLDLRCNSLQDDSLKYLAAHFKHVTNLRSLNISYNSFEESGLLYIAKKMKYISRLEILDYVADKKLDKVGKILLNILSKAPNLHLFDPPGEEKPGEEGRDDIEEDAELSDGDDGGGNDGGDDNDDNNNENGDGGDDDDDDDGCDGGDDDGCDGGDDDGCDDCDGDGCDDDEDDGGDEE